MDKAQEKIIKEAFELLEYQVELQGTGNDLSKYGKSKLRDLMAKLGYHKLPMLSDEQRELKRMNRELDKELPSPNGRIRNFTLR